MQPTDEPFDIVRRVLDSTMYLTLATADEAGRPWASPLWYAPIGYDRFLWVSHPDARHSRNLGDRPDVAIVIFDSTVAIGGAEAVYVEARAEELSGHELASGIDAFSARSTQVGGGVWGILDVVAPASRRLYGATASAAFVLGPRDRRVPVSLNRT